MKNMFRFPLSIQLFNDGGGNGGGGTPNENVKSENPTDIKSSQEYINLKNQFDKLASEVANYKKKEKESLPEIDQLKTALEEQKQATLKAQKEILNSKITNKFSSVGFDEKTVESFIKAYDSGDALAFVDELIKGLNTKIEGVRAEANAKFQQSQTIPNGNNPNPNNKGVIDDLLPYTRSLNKANPLDIINKK